MEGQSERCLTAFRLSVALACRFALLAIVIIPPDKALCQTIIRERIQIQPRATKTVAKRLNQAPVDTSSYLESLSQSGFSKLSTSATSSAAPITLPNGGYVTAQILGGGSSAINDFVLRSPVNQVLVADANHNHGATWISDTYSSSVSFVFGLNWTFRGRQGTEFGMLIFQINDSTYRLVFEDVGIGPLFQDLFVEVVAHGPSTAQTNTISVEVFSAGEIYYGDENFLSFDLVTDDGRSFGVPSGLTFSISVSQGTSTGFLHDYNNNRDGVTLTGVPWVAPFGPDISFRAWGEEPSSAQPVTVAVSTSDPTIVPGSTQFAVLPSKVAVIVDPSNVQQGQNALIEVLKKLPDGTTEPLPANEFLAYYIAQGSSAGSLSSPDGSDNGDFIGGTYHSVTFHAVVDSLLPPSVPVFIQIFTDFFGTGLAKLAVVKSDALDHFEVIAEKDTVVQGETVRIFVISKDANNNAVNIEDGTPLDFSLDDEGAALGRLLTPDGRLSLIPYAAVKDIGTSILTFAANQAPPPALATIFRIQGASSQTISGGSIQSIDDPPVVGKATIKVKKSTDPNKKGSGIVTVKKPRFPAGIELSVSSDQMQHSETIVLKVNLKDGKGVIPTNDGVWGINFFLGAEGQSYGNLNNSVGGADAIMLNNVPYKEASDGSITFVADGASYDERFPLGISVGASVDVNGKVYTDVKGVYLRGANTTGLRFAQSDGSWATDIYDSSGSDISELGCALSCMAMILKVTGTDVNPGTLNKWMSDSSHYYFNSKSGVMWDGITNYDDSPEIGYPENIGGQGLVKSDRKVFGDPISNSNIDSYLSQGYYVASQVKNIKENGSESIHWVVATGKVGNTYAILDPGYSNRTTLNSYSNQVYRLIVYKPRP